MIYYGSGASRRGTGMTAKSKKTWENWLRSRRNRPEKRAVAERWVALMEQAIKEDGKRVFQIAQATLEAAGGENLTRKEIREVVLVLSKVWYLRDSLGIWAVKSNIITRADLQ